MSSKTITLCRLALILACIVGGSAIHGQDNAKKNIESRQAAKEAAVKFLKAAKDENIDRLVALTDTPWYDDGTKIIEEPKDLRVQLKAAWIDPVAAGRMLPDKVARLAKYEDIRKLINGPRREMADRIFESHDWVVFVQSEGKEKGHLFVRVQQGIGRVIGAGQ